MAGNKEWTRFRLTNPPANGDPMNQWQGDVLWVLLEMHEVSKAERKEMRELLVSHPLECKAAKRINAVWSWYGLTIAVLGTGVTVATLVYLMQHIT